MKLPLTIVYLGLILSQQGFSQNTQTLRGRVVDTQSGYQLIGASVLLLDRSDGQVQPLKIDEKIMGTTTDPEGYFKLANVPVGRHSVKVSYVGYEEKVYDNVLLIVGRETMLNVELEEVVIMSEEVVITADKTQPMNEMAMVSSRQFSVEETMRYAGSRADPARMAQNYAGVSNANDARNDIVVRGNSPAGILWRMDGLPIGNPNHFGSLGSTGGPVSMLNANVLTNSDFLTGAFPAEYGNATAGVFDLQMRNGNSEQREYLGQVGFNGFEFGAEGPFSKESRASYLVNGRYSTLGVFQALGMEFGTGTAVPQYQDVSFKVNVPTKTAGTFSLFGIAGTSSISFLDSEADTTKSSDTEFYAQDGYDSRSEFGNGIFGLNHHYFLNTNTYTRVGISTTLAKNIFLQDSLGYVVSGEDTTTVINPNDITPIFEGDNRENRVTVNASFNQKIDARNAYNIGGYLHLINYNYQEQGYERTTDEWLTYRGLEGSSELLELYAQWLHKFNEKFSINSGLHYQQFFLNSSRILEPRFSARYQFPGKQSLNLGYGMHALNLPLAVYSVRTRLPSGGYVETNRGLGFTKSHHFVLGYEKSFAKNWRVKVETYYQSLFDVPVTKNPSSFSMINFGADFGFPSQDSLVNKGTGYNYGAELTVEKFLTNGFYALFTASLFNSRYEGSDGVERNTAYNGNAVINFLTGKEFELAPNKLLAVDFKCTYAGGRRYSPVDIEASEEAGATRRDPEQAYSQQYPYYLRADLKVFFRLQAKKLTQEWGIDIQNITNRRNIFSEQYSRTEGEVKRVYQTGIFPVPLYRILF